MEKYNTFITSSDLPEVKWSKILLDASSGILQWKSTLGVPMGLADAQNPGDLHPSGAAAGCFKATRNYSRCDSFCICVIIFCQNKVTEVPVRWLLCF